MLLKLEFLIVWVLKRVAIKSVKKNLLKNIKQGNQVGKQKPMTRVARELTQFAAKLLCSLEWCEDEDLQLYCSNIYVSNTVNLCRRVVTFYYNLKVARYPNK